MNQSPFDVAIIGAGVCGAAIARTLSAYRLRVVLLEKEADVAFGVSKANSGIIHAGFHHPATSLKAKLEIQGNLMFEKLYYELGFPFKRVGVLVVAFSEEEMKTAAHLFSQGEENGVADLELCGAERVRALEPKVNRDAVGGLYAPGGGIIEPYRFVFALVECAIANGCVLSTGFDVSAVRRQREYFILAARSGRSVAARYAVNAAGLHADAVSAMFGAEQFTIIPRKGEEYLLDRGAEAFPNHVLFPVPAKKSKGILVIPTVEGTTMVGPTAVEVEDREDVSTSASNLKAVFAHAKHLMPSVSRRDIITSFAGMRPALATGDFYIAVSKKVPRLVQVAGIQSPGLTASPAIGEYVKELLKSCGCSLTEKPHFNPMLPKITTLRDCSPEAMEQIIAHNPQYGNIICRCETVSEAQIVEAIRKGHVTLDGIKFYTRAGMGRCQGGFCTYKILKILARETGKKMTEFTKRGGESVIVKETLSAALPRTRGAPP
ncbi:MAG: NAD(P)/FAD-dependent oxidoreductase [Chitinispirillaceae bacterium]|nr:NAD(P)/FAD-dependent oxidoreductase [Chitinispirillaceae bacterium]